MKRKRSRNEEQDDDDAKETTPYIPHEILQDILSRLPVKSLVRSKAINRSFNLLISDPRFTRLHLAQSARQNRNRFMSLSYCTHCPLAYEAPRDGEANRLMTTGPLDGPVVNFLASCHGLVCVSNADDKMFLLNPATRACKKIPGSKIEFPTSPPCTWASVFFGLGYHSGSDDYRLVRVSMFDGDDFQSEVKVYSRNSNAWRRISDFPYDFPLSRTGRFVDGNLHWLIYMRESLVQKYAIVALNLEDEKYRLMRLPDIEKEGMQFADITTLGGNLALFCSYYCHEFAMYEYDVWILKEYGRAEEWTRANVADACMASIEAFVYFEPLCLVGDEAILVQIGTTRFIIYNVKKKLCWEFSMPQMKDTRMVSFLESLVSPRYLGNEA